MGKKPRFVVHEHHATRLHWDFRLEYRHVLKSWAIPKRPPRIAGIRRLAFQVEDHQLSYAGFEGVIPENEYGAGRVKIWDRGFYEGRLITRDKYEVELHGKRLQGVYVLFRFRRAGKNTWLFFKVKSKAQKPERTATKARMKTRKALRLGYEL